MLRRPLEPIRAGSHSPLPLSRKRAAIRFHPSPAPIIEAAVKAHSAQTLAAQFDLHTRLFNNVLDGITDAEAQERARDSVNHLTWPAT